MKTFKEFYRAKKSVYENEQFLDYENDLQTLFEEDVELTPCQKKYASFMTFGMQKFDAESPADLSEDDKKEFFNWIKDNWDSDNCKPKKFEVEQEIKKAKDNGDIPEPKSGKEAAKD